MSYNRFIAKTSIAEMSYSVHQRVLHVFTRDADVV